MKPVKVYSTSHKVGGKHKRRRTNSSAEGNSKKGLSTWEAMCNDVRNLGLEQPKTV